MTRNGVLETARLLLHPAHPAHLLALIEHPADFERLAGCPAATGLQEMFTSGDIAPAWLAALRACPDADIWVHGTFVVLRESGEAIGVAGFKGPPDASGAVEVAYGIVPTCEGHGYATEAAALLTNFAFDAAGTRLVCAHTLPEENASTRVLAKCGFSHVAEVVDPDDGPVWRWELSREQAPKP